MASSSIDVRQINQFDGMNFHTWKIRMEMVLLDKDLFGHVNGSEERPTSPTNHLAWDKRDSKARANILLGLKDARLSHVNKCKTAKEVWDTLTNIYETTHAQTKMYYNR